MKSLQPSVTSSDYLVALRSLGDLLDLHPSLVEAETYRWFTERFPTMAAPEDFRYVLQTLRSLLIEFPNTTEPDAVSAKHQARAVLKKYEAWLETKPEVVPIK